MPKCKDIKFSGKVIDKKWLDWVGGSDGRCPIWTIKLDNKINEIEGNTIDVAACSIQSSKGSYDSNIEIGELVEVYGCFKSEKQAVSLSEKNDYYIKKVNDIQCEYIGGRKVSELERELNIIYGNECYSNDTFDLLILYVEDPTKILYPNVPKVKLLLYDKNKKIFSDNRMAAFSLYYNYYLKKNKELIKEGVQNLLVSENTIKLEKELMDRNAEINVWKEWFEELNIGTLSLAAGETLDLLAMEIGKESVTGAFNIIMHFLDILSNVARLSSLVPIVEGITNDMGNTIYSMEMRHTVLAAELTMFEEAVGQLEEDQYDSFIQDQALTLGNPDYIIENSCKQRMEFGDIGDLITIFTRYNSIRNINNAALCIEDWPIAHAGTYEWHDEGIIHSNSNCNQIRGIKLDDLFYDNIKARNPNFIVGVTYIDRFYSVISFTWFAEAENELVNTKKQIEKFNNLADPTSEEYLNMLKSLIVIHDWMRAGFVYQEIVFLQKNQQSYAINAHAFSEEYKENVIDIIKNYLLISGKLSDSIELIKL